MFYMGLVVVRIPYFQPPPQLEWKHLSFGINETHKLGQDQLTLQMHQLK